ncbi:putative paraquat-inducible protein A [Variovorax sp. CF313]|jgi:paraquat-inducible protein A|uniref:paraquat-inducible protein A n=1 Tax=Variovorax sp. CF313 TaxID=1144315 RepID=UPI000270FA37|nr:paraquat-inducible protein A [Variovorax sp. CF313]EJL80348.1 putative paraquat-inducible protein A [Variovorax sp. CF313]
MTEVPDTVVCPGCDAVYSRTPLQPRDVAHCPRCGTELDRHPGRQEHRILPLTVACLIMFAIANLFPIVEIELQGLRSQTTLAGAVVALGAEGMSVVALLVLATTILFPFLQLCILAYLLVPLSRERRPGGFALLVRLMQSLRPWGMIEVFLLGVLVAIVKLSSMATVVPGAALWAFMALTVMLTVVLSFNPGAFWEMTFRPKGEAQDEGAPAS